MIDRKIKQAESWLKNAQAALGQLPEGPEKEKYSQALATALIPRMFCLDEAGNRVSYMAGGKLQTVWSGNSKLVLFPSRIRAGMVGNLMALASGRKQFAVCLTAKKRRRPDGSYVGSEKTHATKTALGLYTHAARIIADLRRMPDGTFRGNHPKWTKSKINKLLESKRLCYQVLLADNVIVSNKHRVDFFCQKNHAFKMRINNLRQGQGCPECSFKGWHEAKCRQTLEELLGFLLPKSRPEWLVSPTSGRRLELDGYNAERSFAFEYDGIQHFRPSFGQSTEILQRRKVVDLEKDLLCKQHGVYLLRIPYTIRDIQTYAKEQLSASDYLSFKARMG